ncbi:hypothetical protein [Mesorhizobium sp. M00.F.Ca.ET.216.01.1.1]|uniref:hypothetical protein n=1 Tax=Mesorhizobium sp. M00.F.Ca.ET.216.01.1.1 TaxID=2500528 RepID=UPI000FDA74BB|nr:hypothetical protein [Mesorhizobium sp. M00.F.Ca.ET.216.01.1.1]TGQ32382.1 hypothetical protein EN859_028625 [Mesorhizobium sp. M00.F.Ca.ET.216.01.1.1]
MDVKTIILIVILGLVVSLLYDSCGGLARWLIRTAAGRLAREERERFREEWMAHLDECYGKLAMLRHALGCWIASLAMQMPLLSVRTYIYLASSGAADVVNSAPSLESRERRSG